MKTATVLPGIGHPEPTEQFALVKPHLTPCPARLDTIDGAPGRV